MTTRHWLILLLLSTFFFSAAAQPRGGNKKYRNAGMRYLDAQYQHYDSVQKAIHRYAEVGFLEYKSSALLIRQLEGSGFHVDKGVAGMPTSFVASFGKGKPVIALLAEYDALPGLSQDTVPFAKPLVAGASGHGCGHNLLGTASVAAAVAISQWLKEGHAGTIRLYGCPAEEGGGGKAYLVREGLFNDVDAVLDWHPDTENMVNIESGLANVQIRFSFHGKAAHAASAPDKGRSALDAVEAFDYMMNMMREHVPSSSRIHYIITNGGQAPNVVPEYAEVLYYLRSPQRDIVADLKDRAVKAAEGAAMGTGTTMTYEILSGNYERLYNNTLSEVLQRNLEKVGGVSYDAREQSFAEQMIKNSGGDVSRIDSVKKVKPLGTHSSTAQWVSSDVGNITWVAPLASFRMAAFAPAGQGHCWQQVASGGMSIGTKGMMNAARVMCLTAVDLFSHPDVIAKAHQELLSKRGNDFHFTPLLGDRKPALDYRLKK